MHISLSNGFIGMTTSYISNKTYCVTPLFINNKTDFFNSISACYINYENTFTSTPYYSQIKH